MRLTWSRPRKACSNRAEPAPSPPTPQYLYLLLLLLTQYPAKGYLGWGIAIVRSILRLNNE